MGKLTSYRYTDSERLWFNDANINKAPAIPIQPWVLLPQIHSRRYLAGKLPV